VAALAFLDLFILHRGNHCTLSIVTVMTENVYGAVIVALPLHELIWFI